MHRAHTDLRASVSRGCPDPACGTIHARIAERKKWEATQCTKSAEAP